MVKAQPPYLIAPHEPHDARWIAACAPIPANNEVHRLIHRGRLDCKPQCVRVSDEQR